MHELLVIVLRQLRGAWRFRWWMLGTAWTVCVIGWIVIARLPDQYTASARVFVDTRSVLAPVLKGLAIRTGDTGQQIALMTRTLLSTPNLEKVMRMTDLDLKAKTPEDKEVILDDLKKNLQFLSTRKANLYTIKYQGDSPDLAKLVVKSLLTIFMEGNLGEVRKGQDSATKFLEQQIAEYERRIAESEENLSRFKQRNLALLPNESGGYYERLRDMKSKVASMESELRIAEERLNSLQEQIQGEVPSFGIGPEPKADFSPWTAEVDGRIRALQINLDELTVRYTDRHPDIVTTKEQLAKLKQERAALIAEAKREYQGAGLPAYSADTNPVYQQLRIRLSDAESDVAVKRGMHKEYSEQLADFEKKFDTVLAIEREHQELVKTLSGLTASRAEMQSRLESARLGRKADTSADTVQFRVIDPPRVPPKPSAPNRVLMSSAVLVGGILVGFGLAFVMSQLRPTFDERQLMSDVLDVPVLGSVNMVWTTNQIKARKVRNISFVLTLTALIMVFSVVLVLYQFNIEFLPRLAQSLKIS